MEIYFIWIPWEFFRKAVLTTVKHYFVEIIYRELNGFRLWSTVHA